MKRFYCRCGNEIFFENRFCNACNDSLGFIASQQIFINPFTQSGYRFCSNYETLQCNWLIHESDVNPQCCACRLTRMVPNLNNSTNWQRWEKLEATKRRAFYMLLRLNLPIPNRIFFQSQSQHFQIQNQPQTPLLFDFLEDWRTNPEIALDFVYTGHANGVITINVAEADDSFRIATKELMNEPYRTLLGHFRHELGHFYWLQLQNNAKNLKAFRELFGDERIDYNSTMEAFYQDGAVENWQRYYISPYASSHPLEDWAETWAHYQHISETLETACSFGLISSDEMMGEFHRKLSTWMQFSIMLNALNRSMGMSDPYPFVITQIVKQKLSFIDRWIKDANCPR